MSIPRFLCPKPPLWAVDWAALDEQFEWIRAMRDCPQDAVYHAEGNVWIHVRMVCDALAGLEEWRDLPEFDREIVFAAALLHDVAKPVCTRHEAGRITSRGHSARGAIQSRQILWEQAADFDAREQVCALVRYHQSPFHLIDRRDAQRQAFLISQSSRCDLLALLAKSDALGRQCADQSHIFGQIELFREYCREQGCLQRPRQFPSNHSRFLYFRTAGRDPDYLAHEAPKCEVTLMSGLPGSGKDTWIGRHAAHLPAISLDSVREEIGATPTGEQGAVLQLAKERARVLLRAGKDFVWNATNLSRDRRTPLVDLFAAYGARMRIVYVEAGPEALFRQNRERKSAIPDAAIERMMDQWEVPDPTEADEVEWWVDSVQQSPASSG